MDPLVSIIIPIYNVAHYLEKCIQSCIDQTYSNIEIIAVNDGSTDESESVILKFKDDRIKLISKKNGGLNSAREAGINKSEGEYIAIVDGDDFLEITAIESLLRIIIETQSDMVLGGYNLVMADTKKVVGQQFFGSNSFNTEEYIKKFLSEGPNTVCMKLYRKSKIPNTTKYIHVTAGDDLLLSAQWATCFKKVVYTNTIVYNYLLARPGAIMNNRDRKKIDGIFEAFYFVFNYYMNNEYFEVAKKELTISAGNKLYSYLSNFRNNLYGNKHKIREINQFIKQNIRHINNKQIRVMVLLVSLNIMFASLFIMGMQTLKPTLNKHTS